MKREMLSQALNALDDRHISETAVFDPGVMQETPERTKQMKPKRIISIALAAALILALGVAAYAINGIHAARQQELRQDLQIDESNTTGYVEYQVPGEPTQGVTILSSIRDGKSQKVYVNVSPVEEDELPAPDVIRDFMWTLEGTNLMGIASPQLPVDLNVKGDAYFDAIRTYAYDAETKTLTLECHVWIDTLNEVLEGKDSVQLRISFWDGEKEVKTYGSAELHIAQEDSRYFDFGSVSYYDAEHDKEIVLVGLELTPVSATWRYNYQGDAQIQASQDMLKLIEWGNIANKVWINARINFSNGESFSTGGAILGDFEGGTVNEFCDWDRAIDINAVESIVLGDLVLWSSE